ncbi:MAG: site-specific integrase [Pseudomonadota bacterium]|nr:site-specific integrase [Pseudomonadota bacterium]
MAIVFHPLFANIGQQQEVRSLVLSYILQHSNLDVEQEYCHAEAFLQSYSASPDTFKSYRREIERLLQWCWFTAKIKLLDVDRELFEEYLTYAFSPPSNMIASKSAPRFIKKDNIYVANSEWRPYLNRVSKAQKSLKLNTETKAYLMSTNARKALFAGVSTFCTYLLQENYLLRNPVALLRQKSRYIVKTQTANITRKLTDLQWHYVIKVIEEKTKVDIKYERHLFIISVFYMLGLRISEIAISSLHNPVMGDFYRDKDGLWWLKVIGKGNKSREIAVPNEMLNCLKRYRAYLGLTPLPLRDEQTPILHNYKNKGGLSIRQVRTLVQECFDFASTSLQRDNLIDEAQDLMSATVHWLRHTSISADVKHRPRDHVRDDAGHESISTTDRYIDIDKMDRHKSAQDKKLYPELERVEN